MKTNEIKGLVAPLVWQQEASQAWRAETPIGEYTVERAPEGWRWANEYVWSADGSYRQSATVMTCMRAASLSHKQKVKACLIPHEKEAKES